MELLISILFTNGLPLQHLLSKLYGGRTETKTFEEPFETRVMRCENLRLVMLEPIQVSLISEIQKTEYLNTD